MKNWKIEIESTCKYLSDSKKIVALPTNSIFDKGKVGCGGTTIALKNKDKYVICVPFVSLIENKVEQLKNEGLEVFAFYSGVLKRDLLDYLKRVEIPKIMVTYDSIDKLTNWINPQDFKILIDELHILFTEYSYRSDAVKLVLKNYILYKEFCFMTATPLEPEFILDELKHLPVVEAVWNNTAIVEVQSVKCLGKVINTVAQVVNDFKANKYTENAYFFVNSVRYIKDLVEQCGLDNTNCRVIYSVNNKTEVGIERGKTIDSPKKINFLTSTAFEGSDIYDENGLTFIISDSEEAHTLIDISTKFQQIAGRIRNSNYGNKIYHIFSETRYSELSYENFKLQTEQLIEETKQLINDISGKSYAGKVYVNDLYVSKVGNTFTFDPNKVKIDLYHFKISRNIYSLRVNLLSEYKKYGFKSESFDHLSEDLIVKDRIDLSFEEIVKELEKELQDIYRLNYPIRDAAFKKYYFLEEAITKIGFEGIKSANYIITNIKAKLITKLDISQENKVFRLFKEKANISSGDFIEGAKVKQLLKEIYSQLDSKKVAKSTDILNYYEVVDNKEVTRRINKKSVKGYVIIRQKLIFK